MVLQYVWSGGVGGGCGLEVTEVGTDAKRLGLLFETRSSWVVDTRKLWKTQCLLRHIFYILGTLSNKMNNDIVFQIA